MFAGEPSKSYSVCFTVFFAPSPRVTVALVLVRGPHLGTLSKGPTAILAARGAVLRVAGGALRSNLAHDSL